MGYDLSKLHTGLQNLGIILTDLQEEQLMKYYEMLIEKNKVMNLTAITDFDEVIEKHFLDSLSLIRVMDLHQDLKVLDLGTGAGFPGIPLKIAFPELRITLCDSLNKRILFLQEVIEALGLEKIDTTHERAEILAANGDFREQYDLVVSRAVANLSTLSEYCLPFVKVDGNFISYKAGDCDEEVKASSHAISVLGGELKEVNKFSLGESSRAFVMIHKTEKTKKKYPRKAGTPSKEPL